MDDIPKGWKLEAVAPPEFFLRGASQKYRDNYDRIFGAKEEDGGVFVSGMAARLKEFAVPIDSGINPSSINASPGVIVREGD